jgi:hypothetical protein
MLASVAERVEKVDELGRKSGHYRDHVALQAMQFDPPDPGSARRHLTQEQRDRISQAQRLRWARARANA